MSKQKGGARVPVTERALVQRINRALAKQDRKLSKSRSFYTSDGQGPHYNDNLGAFYVVDTNRNMLADSHVNIEGLGRSLEVLAEWEALCDE